MNPCLCLDWIGLNCCPQRPSHDLLLIVSRSARWLRLQALAPLPPPIAPPLPPHCCYCPAGRVLAVAGVAATLGIGPCVSLLGLALVRTVPTPNVIAGKACRAGLHLHCHAGTAAASRSVSFGRRPPGSRLARPRESVCGLYKPLLVAAKRVTVRGAVEHPRASPTRWTVSPGALDV